MPCLKDISLKETGLLGSNFARSASAITAYLPLLDNFIFCVILVFYIYPTILVKFKSFLKLAFCHSILVEKHNFFLRLIINDIKR